MHEWQVIIETLRDEGYRVSETPAMFSPHLLPPERGGRPQVRERVFITATHNPAAWEADSVEPRMTESASTVRSQDEMAPRGLAG